MTTATPGYTFVPMPEWENTLTASVDGLETAARQLAATVNARILPLATARIDPGLESTAVAGLDDDMFAMLGIARACREYQRNHYSWFAFGRTLGHILGEPNLLNDAVREQVAALLQVHHVLFGPWGNGIFARCWFAHAVDRSGNDQVSLAQLESYWQEAEDAARAGRPSYDYLPERQPLNPEWLPTMKRLLTGGAEALGYANVLGRPSPRHCRLPATPSGQGCGIRPAHRMESGTTGRRLAAGPTVGEPGDRARSF